MVCGGCCDLYGMSGIAQEPTGANKFQTKVPERFAPGRFDVWGSSHQIFHICVLLGAASHLAGAIKGFDYNHDPITRRC